MWGPSSPSHSTGSSAMFRAFHFGSLPGRVSSAPLTDTHCGDKSHGEIWGATKNANQKCESKLLLSYPYKTWKWWGQSHWKSPHRVTWLNGAHRPVMQAIATQWRPSGQTLYLLTKNTWDVLSDIHSTSSGGKYTTSALYPAQGNPSLSWHC